MRLTIFACFFILFSASCKKEETGFVLLERHFVVEVWPEIVSGSSDPDSNTPWEAQLCILVHLPNEEAREEFRTGEYTLEVDAEFEYWYPDANTGFCLDNNSRDIYEFNRPEKRVVRRFDICDDYVGFQYFGHSLKR